MLPRPPQFLLRHGVIMRRIPSCLLSACNFSTLFAAALILFVLLSFFSSNTYAQGSYRRSLYDSIEDKDKDNPKGRTEWMTRGREAPKGQSSAALRLRAHHQKMAMREKALGQDGSSSNVNPGSSGWVFLGPAPLVSDENFFGLVSGRVTAIAVDPSDTSGNTVYAAGASGGVWKSTNAANATVGNVTWTPVTDQQGSLTNGAVSVKSDGSVVLVGTGEPDNAIDSYWGLGILRSTDKGATWTPITSSDSGAHSFAGLGFTKFAWSSASGSTSTVVAAAADTFIGDKENLLGNNANWGLYRSTDGGQTWTYEKPTDNSAPISATDVTYNATAGKFFASLQYHGLYSSADGTSWTRLAAQPDPAHLTLANCPTAANGGTCPMFRGQLTTVPGRNEMYFWYENANNGDADGGIWQSTDGGSSWKQISETGITNCGDSGGCGTQQAFYNLEISAVADSDGTSTDIYTGAVNLFRCKLATGATTCSTVDPNLPNSWLNLTHVYGVCSNKASVHPDEHGLDFIVVGGKDIIYFGNDGGVYRALDGYTGLNIGSCNTPGNNSFDNLNATIGSMTQFVSFSIHPTDQNTVLGGTQDNGSPASSTAITSTDFFTALGGDGGYNAIDPTTPTNWYNAFTDVQIGLCTTAPNCNDFNYNEVVSNGSVGGDGGSFYTPYILDPQDSSEMLVGTCRVWRGPASGVSGFSALSFNFDTGDASQCQGQNINVNMVRGLAAGGPKDANGFSKVVYATTEGLGPLFGQGTGGEVWVTTNAGTTLMSDVTPPTIVNNYYTISSVAIDKSDATGHTAYVGIMGFTTSHVFKTTNAGTTWTDWTGSGGTALPDSPVNDVFVDSTAGQIYVGTDVGIFVSSTSSASWAEVGPAPGTGSGYLPNVPVSAIRLFNSGGIKKLRVSTYGRGIWEYNLAAVSPTTTTVVSSQNPAIQGVTVTFTATVTTTGSHLPTGTVTFNDGTTQLGTATLNGSQVATFQTSTLAVGTHSITAVYGGDANNAGSTSTVLSQVITAITTTTALTANPNPAAYGAPVTFTATVSTTGSIKPTGTVTFNDGTTALGMGTLNGSQVATYTTTSTQLAVGANSITAVYAGDANNNGSTSSILTENVNAPTFTVTRCTVAPCVTSTTVSAGGEATGYSFTVAPVAPAPNFGAAVALSCSAFVPSDPTLTSNSCVFSINGTVVTSIPASNGSTVVTLAINTVGPNPAQGAIRNRRADNRSPWLPLALPLAGIVIAGFAGRKVSKHSAAAGLCLSLILLGLLVACGGSSTPPIVVSVSGSPTSLYPNGLTGSGWPSQTAQFTATVNNSSNTAVTWGVTTANGGSIDQNGLYTAPTIALNLPTAITIMATSQADTSKSATASETLKPATIPTALQPGQVPYTVTVTATNTAASPTTQTVTYTLIVQ
jgi:Bacterial Ig-like domain (group 3)